MHPGSTFTSSLEAASWAAGCGVPPAAPYARIREAIDEDPAAWKQASRDGRFKDSFELTGDSLIRAPKGYDPNHPLIVDLRRKDFIGVANLSADALMSDDFLESFAGLCRDAAPFQRWLCRAIGVPY